MRRARGEAGAWAGIAGNAALAAAKITVGALAGSRALLADGLHSVADLVGSVAVLVGLRVASAPADVGHPYGHEKAESVAALLVAAFLFFAGLEVAVTSGIGLIDRPPRVPDASALWVAAGAVVVKELLYRYLSGLGRRFGSEALRVGAREHRSDAVSSLAAVAGIAGARLGLPLLDPAAGVVVSLLIMHWGWDLSRQSVQDLIDARGDPRLLERIRALAAGVGGVGAVQLVRTRRMGASVLVDLEIGVAPSTTLARAHAIAEEVRARLVDGLPPVKDVMVHVNPLASEGARESELAR